MHYKAGIMILLLALMVAITTELLRGITCLIRRRPDTADNHLNMAMWLLIPGFALCIALL